MLRDFVWRGAKVVAPPAQLGAEWVAACTFPIQSNSAEKTKVEKLCDTGGTQNAGFKR